MYASLPCTLTGVGFLDTVYTSGQLHLTAGQGAQFPALSAGQFFYALIGSDCTGCCEEIKVTARSGDYLTVERPDAHCASFPVGTRVCYTSHSVRAVRAIAQDNPPNVASPLVYNCATRTISIDCAALRQMLANDCA
jgi:hypothetical protein